jgi:hypothetical protein
MSTLSSTGHIGFALISLGIVLTPGPNMCLMHMTRFVFAAPLTCCRSLGKQSGRADVRRFACSRCRPTVPSNCL